MSKGSKWRVGRFTVLERVGKLGKSYKVRGRYYGPYEKSFKSREEAFRDANDKSAELDTDGTDSSAVITPLDSDQVRAAEVLWHRGQVNGWDLETIVRRLDRFEHLLLPDSGFSMSEYVDKWLGAREGLMKRGEIAEATYEHNVTHSKWLKDEFGDCRLNDVNSDDLRFHLETYTSNKTYNHKRAAANAIFKQAVVDDLIVKNPIDKIRSMKKRKGKGNAEFLSVEKCRDVLNRAVEYRDGKYIHYVTFGMFAAMRPDPLLGELSRLTPRDVNLTKGVIRVSIDLSKTGLQGQIKLMPVLIAWLKKYPINKFPLVRMKNKWEYGDFRKAIGINDRKYHDVLRHTALTMYYGYSDYSLKDTAKFGRDRETTIEDNYINTMVEIEETVRFWERDLFPLDDSGKVVAFG